MQGKFTEKAKEAIDNAQNAAVDFGHNYVGTEHLLLGLTMVTDSVAAKALEAQGVSAADVEGRIEEVVSGQGGVAAAPQDFTPRTKRVLELSLQEAVRMGTGYIGTEHLLLALVREGDSIAVRIMTGLGVNVQRLYDDILNMLGEGDKQYTSAPMNAKNIKKTKNRHPNAGSIQQRFHPVGDGAKIRPHCRTGQRN